MKQLGQLHDEVSDYAELGWQVLAIAQDGPETNNRVMKKQKLSFPILSDDDMDAAKKFGVVFSVDDETLAVYKKYNIDLVGLYGRERPLMAVPSVFLIGTDGKIKFSYVNPDYRERLDTKVLRTAMEVYK